MTSTRRLLILHHLLVIHVFICHHDVLIKAPHTLTSAVHVDQEPLISVEECLRMIAWLSLHELPSVGLLSHRGWLTHHLSKVNDLYRPEALRMRGHVAICRFFVEKSVLEINQHVRISRTDRAFYEG